MFIAETVCENSFSFFIPFLKISIIINYIININYNKYNFFMKRSEINIYY